jgi:nitrite reductase/ring-hydroxylating ferredoxin subunit
MLRKLKKSKGKIFQIVYFMHSMIIFRMKEGTIMGVLNTCTNYVASQNQKDMVGITRIKRSKK